MQFYFYVSNLLKALFDLQDEASFCSLAHQVLPHFFSLSHLFACSVQDSHVPIVPKHTSLSHVPCLSMCCLSAMQVYLPQWIWKIPMDLQVSSQASLPLGSPWPCPPLLISSITCIAPNWNCSFLYLDWSSLAAGLVSLTPHPLSLTQCLAQMSTWEMFLWGEWEGQSFWSSSKIWTPFIQTACLSFMLIGLLRDLGAGRVSVTLVCLDSSIGCHFPPPISPQSPHLLPFRLSSPQPWMPTSPGFLSFSNKLAINACLMQMSNGPMWMLLK